MMFFDNTGRDDGGDDDDELNPFRNMYARLEGHAVVPMRDGRAWAEWFETAERRVAQTELGAARVSTVFLGLNHAFNGGPPLWFETMIFRGRGWTDCYPHRYPTWDTAEAGHAMAVEMERRGLSAWVLVERCNGEWDFLRARVWGIDGDGAAMTSEGCVPVRRVWRNRRRVAFRVETLRRHFGPRGNVVHVSKLEP